jgi:hypothetical protein
VAWAAAQRRVRSNVVCIGAARAAFLEATVLGYSHTAYEVICTGTHMAAQPSPCQRMYKSMLSAVSTLRQRAQAPGMAHAASLAMFDSTGSDAGHAKGIQLDTATVFNDRLL